MIYYIPAFLLLLISILYYSKGNANKNIAFALWLFFCFYTVVLVGCRYKVGTDWASYYELFNDKQFDFFNSGIAFYLIKVILRSVSLGFQSYVFIMFLISFLVKVIAFRKITSKYIICLMLYFSFWYLTYEANGMKQGAALGFVLLAVYYTLKRDLKAYLVCIFMAFCFHNAAVIFLPFFWLTKIDLPKIWVYSIVVGTIIISHLGLGENLILMFSERFADSYFAQKSIHYAIDEAYNSNILLSFKSLHKLAILIVSMEFCTRYQCSQIMKNVIIWGVCLSCVIYFSFSQFEIIATRLSLYYRVIEIIALSFLPFVFKKNWTRVLIIVTLFLYSAFQIWNVLQIKDGGLIPYNNILF